MSIVLSILKEPYGAEAFAVSSHFSRGSEKCGRLLVLVILAWGLGLRLACLQARCNVRGSGILIQVMLLCMGNVVKWMVFMVYFHNCKKRILRKAIAGEVGVEDKLWMWILLMKQKPERRSTRQQVEKPKALYFVFSWIWELQNTIKPLEDSFGFQNFKTQLSLLRS